MQKDSDVRNFFQSNFNVSNEMIDDIKIIEFPHENEMQVDGDEVNLGRLDGIQEVINRFKNDENKEKQILAVRFNNHWISVELIKDNPLRFVVTDSLDRGQINNQYLNKIFNLYVGHIEQDEYQTIPEDVLSKIKQIVAQQPGDKLLALKCLVNSYLKSPQVFCDGLKKRFSEEKGVSAKERFRNLREQQKAQEFGEEVEDLLEFYEEYFQDLRNEYGNNPQIVERYLTAMREDQIFFDDFEEPQDEGSFWEKRFSDCKPEAEEEKILANKIIEFFALKYPELKERYENNSNDFVFKLKDKTKLNELIEKIDNTERETSINESVAPKTIDLQDAIVFYEKSAYKKLTTPRRDRRLAFVPGTLLIGVDLSKIKLSHVHFDYAIMIGASFKGNKKLKNLYFQYTDLSCSIFYEAKLNDCDFSYTNLTNVSFIKSHIRGQFSGSILVNTKFNKSIIHDSVFAGIKHKNNNPDFSESLIQDTRFGSVEFDGAKMNEVILIGASKRIEFNKCKFYNFDFAKGVWLNVYFENSLLPCFQKELEGWTRYIHRTISSLRQYIDSDGRVRLRIRPTLSISVFCLILFQRERQILYCHLSPCDGLLNLSKSRNVFINNNLTWLLYDSSGLNSETREKFEQLGMKINDTSEHVKQFMKEFSASAVAIFASTAARTMFCV